MALYLFMHHECVHVNVNTSWTDMLWNNWCKTDYDSSIPSDLGHVQGCGHFLQLCLHCAVAERSFQH